MENPCHNCPKRYPGCHASRDDYKSWKVNWDEMRERGSGSVKAVTAPIAADSTRHFTRKYEVTNNGSCDDSQGR